MKYKINLKKLSYLFLSFALITSFVSCERTESVPDESDIVLQEMIGTWIVNIDEDGVPQAEHTTISTYNASENSSDALWLDDQQHGWGLKAKADVNFGDLSFSGTDLDELYYDVTVTITEGKITKGGATTPSGDVVDSIYFKAEFSDIPGQIWEYYGYKSTAKILDYQ